MKTKKPIAVVITDTHMSDKNIPLVKDIFEQTFEYCKSNGIEHIFHAGDWFNSRTGQSIDCLLATKIIFDRMSSEHKLQMHLIAGNHDKDNQKRVESFLSVFEDVIGVDLIGMAGGFPFEEAGVYVGMVPFFTDEIYSQELKELTEYIFDDPIKDIHTYILITHAAINGVKNNDGSEVTHGISPKDFSKWDKVLVGHYHDGSKIGKNIYYIGSGYQANFGENGKKGITVIYEDGSIELVKLNFPEYVKLEIDAKTFSAKGVKDLEYITKEYPDRKIRVVLTGSEEEVNSFRKDQLEKMGISVTKKPNDVEALEPEEVTEALTFNKENLTAIFEEFCDNKKIEDREYGRKTLSKI